MFGTPRLLACASERPTFAVRGGKVIQQPTFFIRLGAFCQRYLSELIFHFQRFPWLFVWDTEDEDSMHSIK